MTEEINKYKIIQILEERNNYYHQTYKTLRKKNDRTNDEQNKMITDEGKEVYYLELLKFFRKKTEIQITKKKVLASLISKKKALLKQIENKKEQFFREYSRFWKDLTKEELIEKHFSHKSFNGKLSALKEFRNIIENRFSEERNNFEETIKPKPVPKLTDEEMLKQFQKLGKLIEDYYRECSKWTKVRLEKVLNILKNKYYLEYLKFAIKQREKNIEAKEKARENFFNNYKELLSSINFDKYISYYRLRKDEIREKKWKKYEDKNYDLNKEIEDKEINPFRNYLRILEQLEDIKWASTFIKPDDTSESLKLNKPADYSILLKGFYTYYKKKLREIEMKEKNIFDYKKHSKYVREYYETLEKELRKDEVFIPFYEENKQYYNKIANDFLELLKKKGTMNFREYRDAKWEFNNILGYNIVSERNIKINQVALLKLIKEQTEKQIIRFLRKNTIKISEILDGRDDFDHFEHNINFQDGTVQGFIDFYFKNGDQFTVKNKLVWVVSVNGKLFCRFPTTFHNIIIKKEKTNFESQEWMIKNFNR